MLKAEIMLLLVVVLLLILAEAEVAEAKVFLITQLVLAEKEL